ncbi:tyrosine-type recombinase/integrase [Rhodomicrobium udaipurense]|uniref:Tyrosine-type recombinase/integrase n=2 Tax=Rhodomicrobium udaipurense TaxID=1202716 RepID=A0A8I1GCC8_9HYPH|nr:tyrosine-type recombinase/integrase [Rhodomicrobium udaipurense]
MATIKLQFVTRDRDRHGNIRFYFRRPGKAKIRLPGAPGSEEFMAAYKEALAGENGASRQKTFDWLCKQYYASQRFASLEDITRDVKRRHLDSVRDTAFQAGAATRRVGDLPFSGLTRERVRKLRDMKERSMANHRLKHLSALFEWAIKEEITATNPCKGVSRVEYEETGYYTWTEQDLDKFERHWPIGTREHLAMCVMLYLGVRVSDAVRIGPGDEAADGQTIIVHVHKGRKRIGKVLTLPILPPLREAIDACKTGDAYLLTQAGKPFASTNSFGNWFRDDVCRPIGLPECSSHGLRKIAATRCAEAGASEYEMMALFGWDDPKMARKYTKAAAQKKMAASAAGKMLGSVSPSVPPEKKCNKINAEMAGWRTRQDSNL